MVTNEQVSAQHQSLHCPVCGQVLSFRIARGRKSGKPFLMAVSYTHLTLPTKRIV